MNDINFYKQLLDTGLDSLKPSKKESIKAGEFLEDKIVDAVTKSNGNKIVKNKRLPKK